MYEASKKGRMPKNKQLDTLRMSHFLHGCWGYHDWHGYLEAQDSSCHVYPAHINENSWAKPAFFSSIFQSSTHQYVNILRSKTFEDHNEKAVYFFNLRKKT